MLLSVLANSLPYLAVFLPILVVMMFGFSAALCPCRPKLANIDRRQKECSWDNFISGNKAQLSILANPNPFQSVQRKPGIKRRSGFIPRFEGNYHGLKPLLYYWHYVGYNGKTGLGQTPIAG